MKPLLLLSLSDPWDRYLNFLFRFGSHRRNDEKIPIFCFIISRNAVVVYIVVFDVVVYIVVFDVVVYIVVVMLLLMLILLLVLLLV